MLPLVMGISKIFSYRYLAILGLYTRASVFGVYEKFVKLKKVLRAQAKNLANDFGLPENFPFLHLLIFLNENPKIKIHWP